MLYEARKGEEEKRIQHDTSKEMEVDSAEDRSRCHY